MRMTQDVEHNALNAYEAAQAMQYNMQLPEFQEKLKNATTRNPPHGNAGDNWIHQLRRAAKNRPRNGFTHRHKRMPRFRNREDEETIRDINTSHSQHLLRRQMETRKLSLKRENCFHNRVLHANSIDKTAHFGGPKKQTTIEHQLVFFC